MTADDTAHNSAHDFTFTSIDGEPLPLSAFRGWAVLLVNTASLCEFTPQYEGLQRHWERYRERGLAVIGVPSNDFGEQEPGSADEIAAFCRNTFAVSFPLTEKQSVVGGEAHPFFRWLEDEFGEAAAPRWNFHKYLIAPDGSLVGAWPSRVPPNAPEITQLIEETLPR